MAWRDGKDEKVVVIPQIGTLSERRAGWGGEGAPRLGLGSLVEEVSARSFFGLGKDPH